MSKTLRFDLTGTNDQLWRLCGPLDEHLRQIEQGLGVTIARRSNHFEVTGPRTEQASNLIRQLHEQAQAGELSLESVQLGIAEVRTGHVGLSENALPNLKTRRSDVRPRSVRQAQYIENILQHDITFGTGPAGTGKTWLAVACAIDALERDNVQRLILTRPAVEAGERLGFLPGDLTQKVDPYLRPLYDALWDLMGFDKVQRLFEKQTIEIAPLAYMRGRTLNNAFVILDEAQNTTPQQMKMFLTRIGFGSKAVITGDPTQMDLPKGQTSGLGHALTVLADVKGIASTVFTSADVVRHPLVARIVDAYEKAGSHHD
ncbi:PhoH family protein [Orrella marina]|uniref:PhoH-like protein n=1 Tax=Orrella marina TaxID=2163011 RepID=A0A2R4XIZ5_9BURK|nr:PhoH family protein [Orrella marina]AWB33689.1 phosphate starvation-inducible protein PhoH [Orrella marina]